MGLSLTRTSSGRFWAGYLQSSYCLVFFFFNFLGCTTGHVGSWFPNQGLNLHPLLGRQNLNWASREVPCSPHTVIFFGGWEGGCARFLLLHGLCSSCGEWGLLSRCSTPASPWGGFSHCRAQGPGSRSFSSCGSHALEYRLSSWGTQAVAAWHVGSSRIRAPALTAGFFTTEPPGRPPSHCQQAKAFANSIITTVKFRVEI